MSPSSAKKKASKQQTMVQALKNGERKNQPNGSPTSNRFRRSKKTKNKSNQAEGSDVLMDNTKADDNDREMTDAVKKLDFGSSTPPAKLPLPRTITPELKKIPEGKIFVLWLSPYIIHPWTRYDLICKEGATGHKGNNLRNFTSFVSIFFKEVLKWDGKLRNRAAVPKAHDIFIAVKKVIEKNEPLQGFLLTGICDMMATNINSLGLLSESFPHILVKAIFASKNTHRVMPGKKRGIAFLSPLEIAKHQEKLSIMHKANFEASLNTDTDYSWADENRFQPILKDASEMFEKQRAGKKTITRFTCVEAKKKAQERFSIASKAEELLPLAWNLYANTNGKRFDDPAVSLSMWKEFGEETFNAVADNEKEKIQSKARQFFFKLATTPPDIFPEFDYKTGILKKGKFTTAWRVANMLLGSKDWNFGHSSELPGPVRYDTVPNTPTTAPITDGSLSPSHSPNRNTG